MPRVIPDIVTGPLIRRTLDGDTAYRRFKVLDLYEGTEANKRWMDEGKMGAKAAQAVSDSGGNFVPALGSAHPTLIKFYCTEVAVTPVANARDQAFVDLQYTDMGNITVRLNGITVRDTTRFDSSGHQIVVLYNPTGGRKVPTRGTTGTYEQYPSVPFPRPGAILEFDKWEFQPKDATERNIYDIQRAYQSAINSQAWQNSPPYTWLCSAVIIQEMIRTTNGQRMPARVKYIFEFKGRRTDSKSSYNSRFIDTHNPLCLWTDYNTRQPVNAVQPMEGGYGLPNQSEIDGKGWAGNGWKSPIVSPTIDFNDLQLPKLWTTK